MSHHWTTRLGIPRPLLLGYAGLLLFMIGDGVESNYLSPFLTDRGFTDGQAASVITAYGVAAAIAAWFSGTLSALWGPKRVMWLGAGIWTVFQIVFLAAALPTDNYTVVMLSYAIRGLGYPLFAFSFLIWVIAVAPVKRVGTAIGWFWFGFTGGLPTFGSLVASGSIPLVGEYGTLWVALVIVVAGSLVACLGLKEPTGSRPMVENATFKGQMIGGIDILWRSPKVALAGIVRIINTAPQYGFFVFLPIFFTKTIGLTLQQYLLMVTLMFAANLPAGLIFGALGDRIGWRRTVTWFGCVGCAIATLAIYYGPMAFKDNFWVATVCAMFWGFILSGFTPIPALLLSMGRPEDRGSAFAVYSLGAGLAAFVGPALVAVFRPLVGVHGLVWVFTLLYLAAALMSHFLKSPSDPQYREDRTATPTTENRQPIAG
ncbi:MFS transporter [Streptomyces violens]|uniref:MFS transporter n=1 Tax=Streptomyces violens TaxID=66377 RepID=UPI00056C594D|nr:MFS transporter [Streptomyces violens]